MNQDELKDGAIVTIGSDKYLTKKQPDIICTGCSFFDLEKALCNRPAKPYCFEGNDYYIYIKLEK